MNGLVPRLAQARLASQLRVFRAVVVNGPRQAGKTTLLRLHQHDHGGEYRSLDDPALLTAAIDDPSSFVESTHRPLIIDEVQRGGDRLVVAIKLVTDTSPARGQFVLSGSTNFLTVPTLSESLAGRIGFVEVWPFSTAERTGGDASFIETVFDEPTALLSAETTMWTRRDYFELACTGGYPEVVEIPPGPDRRSWFNSYLRTVIDRDVREFARIEHGALIPRLLSLVAARAGSTSVLTDLAASLEIGRDTVRSYLAYLATVYLASELHVWSTNLSSKVAKTPKLYVTDSGLAAHLLRVDADGLAQPGNPALGGIIETFVATELRRLQSVSETTFELSCYRDRDHREIDFVLEGWDGRVVAIEVKASASPSSSDARHLRWLRDRIGDRLRAGIMLYLGQQTLSLGRGVFAVPLSALWQHRQLS